MSRRDTSHETVRRPLERDGWTITHDPYPIRLDQFALDEEESERSLYLPEGVTPLILAAV